MPAYGNANREALVDCLSGVELYGILRDGLSKPEKSDTSIEPLQQGFYVTMSTNPLCHLLVAALTQKFSL